MTTSAQRKMRCDATPQEKSTGDDVDDEEEEEEIKWEKLSFRTRIQEMISK